jgi:hypothetical protein
LGGKSIVQLLERFRLRGKICGLCAIIETVNQCPLVDEVLHKLFSETKKPSIVSFSATTFTWSDAILIDAQFERYVTELDN